MNGYCPACHQPVSWALTENRKWLAIDPDPDPAGNQAAYRDGTGRWLTRQLAKDTEPYGWERRYMPHIATCTSPGRRRPAPPQAPAPLPTNVIPITAARQRRQARQETGTTTTRKDTE